MSDNQKTASQTAPRGTPKQRVRHKAKHIRMDGAVSALCFKVPRAIDMKVASWVLRDEAVTCRRCKEILND